MRVSPSLQIEKQRSDKGGGFMSVPSTGFMRFENGFSDNNSSGGSGGFKNNSTNFGSGGLDSDAFKPKGIVLYISDGFLFSEVFLALHTS
jgi:hypothetical protein